MHAIAQDATRIRHKSGQRPLQRGPDQRGIARAITAELMALCGGAKTDAATARPLVLGVRLVVSCAGLWWRHKLRSALRLVQNERLI